MGAAWGVPAECAGGGDVPTPSNVSAVGCGGGDAPPCDPGLPPPSSKCAARTDAATEMRSADAAASPGLIVRGALPRRVGVTPASSNRASSSANASSYVSPPVLLALALLLLGGASRAVCASPSPSPAAARAAEGERDCRVSMTSPSSSAESLESLAAPCSTPSASASAAAPPPLLRSSAIRSPNSSVTSPSTE